MPAATILPTSRRRSGAVGRASLAASSSSTRRHQGPVRVTFWHQKVTYPQHLRAACLSGCYHCPMAHLRPLSDDNDMPWPFDPAPSANAALEPVPGELEQQMRAYPWESTPVGSVAQWPFSLKLAVRTLLDCQL